MPADHTKRGDHACCIPHHVQNFPASQFCGFYLPRTDTMGELSKEFWKWCLWELFTRCFWETFGRNHMQSSHPGISRRAPVAFPFVLIFIIIPNIAVYLKILLSRVGKTKWQYCSFSSLYFQTIQYL